MRAILLPLLLAGCASTQPTVIRETVEVRIPVPVRCQVETPVSPASRVDQLKQGPWTPADVVPAALADLTEQRAYTAQLAAALEACK